MLSATLTWPIDTRGIENNWSSGDIVEGEEEVVALEGEEVKDVGESFSANLISVSSAIASSTSSKSLNAAFTATAVSDRALRASPL
jgi:hypothetical protein